MSKPLLWILLIFLIGLHLFIECFFLNTIHFDDLFGIIDVIMEIVTTFVIGIVIGGVSAFIPRKGKTYRQRFYNTFLISAIAVLTIVNLSTGYVAYLKKIKGVELRPLKY